MSDPDPARWSCRSRAGGARAWDIELDSSLAIDPSALGMARADTNSPQLSPVSQLRATLQVEVLRDTTREGTVLLARFDHVDQATIRRASPAFTSPFLLRVGTDCAVSGFARGRTVVVPAARAAQVMVHELWFSVPSSAESVVLEGRDATGVFAATLARGDGDGTTIQRRIHNYRRLWDDQATSVVVDKSFLTVRRDAGVWFASMSGEGSLHGGGMTSSRTTLRVSSREPDPALFAQASRDEASYVWEDLLPGAASPLLSSSMTAAQLAEREKFKHVTPDAALEQFLHDVQSNDNIDSQWRGLAAYFEARPETIPRFRRTLSENLLPPTTRAPAFLALGRARVPEAREALVAINRDHSTTVLNRSQAAILLAVRSDVDVSLARSLRADAMRLPDQVSASPTDRAYARSAVLALGIMGNVQRDRLPDAANEAKGMIADLLQQAHTAAELSPVFGAIGNLGDVSLLPEVDHWSRHSDAAIRMGAAAMIRRIPLQKSETIILDWLARETSPGVKREIYGELRGVLDDHPAELSSALTLQASRDLRAQPDIITRQTLVRVLGPQAAKSPEAKAALLAQIPQEAGRADGLYTLLSQYLPGDEVSAALDPMPASGDR